VCLWLCTASVHNTKQNSSDNLPSYLQTNIIAQMLSIRGEGAECLEKLKESHDLLAACGMQLPVTQDVISDLEQFVMRYVYGDTKSKKQEFARHEGCEMESSEEEKHNPTCSWFGQSPSAPYVRKLSCIFAEALQATKSPLPNQPWMASCKWSMSAVRSTQPPLPQSMPLAQADMNSSGDWWKQ